MVDSTHGLNGLNEFREPGLHTMYSGLIMGEVPYKRALSVEVTYFNDTKESN